MEDYLQKILLIQRGLNKKYPNGDNPFEIITRLCEEAGELAQAVNHFEGTGKKVEKHGEPDKNKLAKEVQDVIRSALNIADYYHIEDELRKSIDEGYERLVQDGFMGK